MIAYNKTLLDNSLLVEEAQNLKKAGFISKEQYQKIDVELPALKTQKNWLLRILFFILGCFLYSSICGAVSIFLMSAIDSHFNLLLYLYAIIGITGIEIMSRKSNFFNYGLDNTFLLGAEIFLCSAIFLSSNESWLLVFCCLFLISGFSYLRYLHLLSFLLACIGFTGSIAFLAFEFGTIGKSLLPFIMMFSAVLLHYIARIIPLKFNLTYYYKALPTLKTFSLLLFYLSGNYLIVRELSILLLNNEIPPNQEITFAPFFYLFTVIIPLLYIVFALKQKDRIMLWTGILTLGFSIYTIRYYHHILPTEAALTIGGIILFAITYFAIKKLKNNTTGMTFQEDRFSGINISHAETLVAVSQFGMKAEVKTDSNIDFGGGGFSGGGSTGEY